MSSILNLRILEVLPNKKMDAMSSHDIHKLLLKQGYFYTIKQVADTLVNNYRNKNVAIDRYSIQNDIFNPHKNQSKFKYWYNPLKISKEYKKIISVKPNKPTEKSDTLTDSEIINNELNKIKNGFSKKTYTINNYESKIQILRGLSELLEGNIGEILREISQDLEQLK